MNKKPIPRAKVELNVWWGNDDVDASIRISQNKWKDIQNGATYVAESTYWYEVRKYRAQWAFVDRKLDVHGDEGLECALDMPVDLISCDLVDPKEAKP